MKTEYNGCCNPTTLNGLSDQRKFLTNRLERAFIAGWEACENNVPAKTEPVSNGMKTIEEIWVEIEADLGFGELPVNLRAVMNSVFLAGYLHWQKEFGEIFRKLGTETAPALGKRQIEVIQVLQGINREMRARLEAP